MLKDPVPGLRRLHNKSNDVAKAQIVVAAGAELEVPDDVANQLQAASQAFADGPAPKAPAKKAPAKKAAKKS